MIISISLNPSIEKRAVVEDLVVNNSNIIKEYSLSIGEGGIYSAYIIKIMQGEPYVLGFAGGIGGRYIKNFLDKNRIKSDFLWKEEESKSILRIIDTIQNTETVLIGDYFNYIEQDYKRFKYKLSNLIKDTNTVIINGPFLENKCNDILELAIELTKEKSKKAIVALEGNNIARIIEYSPFVVVLNEKDIEELGISKEADINEIIIELHNILKSKRIHYIIFDYIDKMFVLSKNKICQGLNNKKYTNNNKLGIKDAIAGAVAISAERKHEIEKMLKLAMAIKIAFNEEVEPNTCKRKEIDRNFKKIKIKELYSSQKGYISELNECIKKIAME